MKTRPRANSGPVSRARILFEKVDVRFVNHSRLLASFHANLMMQVRRRGGTDLDPRGDPQSTTVLGSPQVGIEHAKIGRRVALATPAAPAASRLRVCVWLWRHFDYDSRLQIG